MKQFCEAAAKGFRIKQLYFWNRSQALSSVDFLKVCGKNAKKQSLPLSEWRVKDQRLGYSENIFITLCYCNWLRRLDSVGGEDDVGQGEEEQEGCKWSSHKCGSSSQAWLCQRLLPPPLTLPLC